MTKRGVLVAVPIASLAVWEASVGAPYDATFTAIIAGCVLADDLTVGLCTVSDRRIVYSNAEAVARLLLFLLPTLILPLLINHAHPEVFPLVQGWMTAWIVIGTLWHIRNEKRYRALPAEARGQPD